MNGEHEIEPVRGLPERLPSGEPMLWQGSPDARGLALRTFHARKVAVYFALLAAWRGIVLVYDGANPLDAAFSAGIVAAVGAVAVGTLALLGWLVAHNTIYTITRGRVVIRSGVALSVTVNLPYRVIETAGLKLRGDGTGDILMTLVPGERVSWPVLWPNVRPWRLMPAEPMLRSVPDAETVARILGRALAASADLPAPAQTAPIPAGREVRPKAVALA